MDIAMIVIIFVIPTLSYIYVITNYKKYNKVNSKINSNGYNIANHILTQNGLEYVGVEKIDGSLKDRYNSSKKIVYLSEDTYNNTSIASISIASFECAHAVQDVKDNIVLKMKELLYPVVKLLTTFSYWVVIFGFVLHWDNLMYIGIGITMIGLFINLFSLYIEFDAKKKGLDYLKKFNLVTPDEYVICNKFLKSYCFKDTAEMMTNSLRFFNLILIKDDQREENSVNNK